jgi:hypothetical protein
MARHVSSARRTSCSTYSIGLDKRRRVPRTKEALMQPINGREREIDRSVSDLADREAQRFLTQQQIEDFTNRAVCHVLRAARLWRSDSASPDKG